MKIGELAEQTGLAPSRIRFYERIGLLKTVKRQSNGYRSYPPEAVLVLGMITAAQKAGFSLDELRTLLPSDLTQWNHQALTSALRQKIQDIEEIQQRLADSKSQLQDVLTQVEAKPNDMDCATNARRVWSQISFGEAAAKATSKSDSTIKH
ncbi:MerR family transcriptional regulator [Pseudomonas sp.]|uniref:MerR family transcriptional regulator n=1 Tax=Pseudomonas sp. TaxID=306 RepID=UPI003CC56CDC